MIRFDWSRNFPQVPVHPVLEEFENEGFEGPFDYRNAIVFEKLRFEDVFRPHENKKPAFSNFSGFEERVRDGLDLTVVLTEDIKLRLQILPSSMNAVRMTTLDIFCSARAFACIPMCL